LLNQILDQQHGLTLVSLTNLPVQSLSQPAVVAPAATGSAAGNMASPPASTAAGERRDMGPFLHPVELVIDGDYASVVAYLRALESLPWRLHWERLELKTGDYPVSRVRIVIGALSLSKEWISL
jgi:MSHA biogenesis protein MshJ